MVEPEELLEPPLLEELEEELEELLEELPEEDMAQLIVVETIELSLFVVFGSGIPDTTDAMFCTTILQASTRGTKKLRVMT